MKKIISLVLCMVMLLALAACGSTTSTTSTTSNSGSSEQSASSSSQSSDSGSTDVDWSGNITMYVPANAGGGTDMMARTMAQGVSDLVGNNITILNNTDGGGVVALETVRTAKPDGKNLLQYGLIVLVNEAMGKYEHSITDEFTIIAAAPADNVGDQVLVAAADSPYQTLDDIKNATDELLFGVQMGGSTHVVSAMITKALDLNARFVEAGSDTEKLTALVGGNIDLCVVGVNQAQQYIESGMAVGLGLVSSTEEGGRSERIPDVKSFVEQGYTDVVWTGMQIILGPAGMDEALVQEINQAYIDAYPNCKQTLDDANLGMKFENVEDSRALVQQYSEMIKGIVEELNLTVS